MIGQWIGTYEGINVTGDLFVNIEKKKKTYHVIAAVNPDDLRVPSSVAYAVFNENKINEQIDVSINAVDPRDSSQCKWEDIKELYESDIIHLNKATAIIKIINDELHLSAASKEVGGIFLTSVLKRPLKNQVSDIIPEVMSWDDFKNKLNSLDKSNFFYRGQQKPWKLRTSFHRGGRYHLIEYINSDIKRAHQKLSSITSHYFDLSIPDQNGSFLNLLQHHGYPTPLLDWSYSPYVASFFAFKDINKNNENMEGFVRIFIFDYKKWENSYDQIRDMNPPFPNLSVMEFISINNPRLIPQQAVTTITNIDDIEDYILKKEVESGEQFIRAIDIPIKERNNVIEDLKFMGITAGSLFPSIDGICEELKETYF